MRMMAAVFLTYCACEGQSITVGALGGGRVTDDVTLLAIPESRRYVAGPSVEVSLAHGLAVEFDALYHRNRYIWATGNFAESLTQLERANSWELPLLAKYYVPLRGIKPFVVAGLAPRTITGAIYEYGYSINVQTGAQTPFSGTMKTNWSSGLGFVTGGGLQFSIGHLQLAPQVRYTYWLSTPMDTFTYSDTGFKSTQQQVDVVMGIGWRLR